jgi:transposase
LSSDPVYPALLAGRAPSLQGAMSGKPTSRDCDFALYRERNLIERFFNKIKHFRAIAPRYDKLAITFLAAVQLVSAIILLN